MFPTLKRHAPTPEGKFRVIEEHFMFPKCRFASDDPKAVATWLRENGGYGQPIKHDAGLHVATADNQYIRSGPTLDRWIDDALAAPANQ
ncbi:hypothetical protein BN2476_360023 [Paraburkholderia piptadeniae]|uniref:Uncharacterized protein n=2 Tax=Paraburkholderia TaxID=1822464 RepID=A0A7X1TKB3_9BURK|nr:MULTISPECIES: hypothetical protein [Paraburkholderia]MPW18174.1 hypothetical protein [Paraburkholderia franconis]MPW22406.1 hypothetical protein [Paraburkholderia franconis]SIT43898.1 hypothetical protein BN2476_360023 [Paraburkholderia piptadeniae]